MEATQPPLDKDQAHELVQKVFRRAFNDILETVAQSAPETQRVVLVNRIIGLVFNHWFQVTYNLVKEKAEAPIG